MGLRYLCYLPFSSRAPETQLGFRDENLPECRLQLQDENIKAKKFGSRGLNSQSTGAVCHLETIVIHALSFQNDSPLSYRTDYLT